jgi:hypothetical protein
VRVRALGVRQVCGGVGDNAPPHAVLWLWPSRGPLRRIRVQERHGCASRMPEEAAADDMVSGGVHLHSVIVCLVRWTGHVVSGVPAAGLGRCA